MIPGLSDTGGVLTGDAGADAGGVVLSSPSSTDWDRCARWWMLSTDRPRDMAKNWRALDRGRPLEADRGLCLSSASPMRDLGNATGDDSARNTDGLCSALR